MFRSLIVNDEGNLRVKDNWPWKYSTFYVLFI